MTSYQSIPAYQDDNIDGDRVIQIPDRAISQKRRIIGGIFAFGLLMVGYLGKNNARVQGHLFNAQQSTFFSLFGDNGPTYYDDFHTCSLSQENSCKNKCCGKRSFFPDQGVCYNECCSNADCAVGLGIPEAGEWGAAFCYEGQCKTSSNEATNENGVRSSIPAEGYPVWLPSETKDNSRKYRKVTVPRVVHEEAKPLFEQVWYFDLNEQGEGFNKDDVMVSDTEISIPVWTPLHAAYSKSYHAWKEHETGIVTLVFGDNEMSMVTDYPKASFVEKYHTITFEGEQDHTRSEFIKKKARVQLNEPWDYDSWVARASSLFMDTSKKSIITGQVEAGIDRGVSWQVRRFTNEYKEEDFGSVNPTSSKRWEHHTERAKAAIELARNPDLKRDYLKSEQHCKHFENFNGVGLIYDGEGEDKDATHVTFPLGRPFTTLSGEMVNAPVHYLGFVVGYVIAHYDADTNVLQLFYQGHSNSREPGDPNFHAAASEPALHVSPVAEGPEYYVDPKKDGRADSVLQLERPSNDSSYGFLGPLFMTRPEVDYTLWARPRSDTCDPAIIDDPMWEEIDLPSVDNSIYELMAMSAMLTKGTVEGMPCADVWMRNDAGAGTHNFDANEMGVWTHFLAEVPDVLTKPMGLGRFWDHWECFYGGKDMSICEAERPGLTPSN